MTIIHQRRLLLFNILLSLLALLLLITPPTASFSLEAPRSCAPAPAPAPVIVAKTKTKTLSFSTQIYIEDTDAYGVVYNGNYLKFYDRALYSVCEGDWSILRVDNHRFKSSPKLGDQITITGEKITDDDNNNKDDHDDTLGNTMQTWELQMKDPDTGHVHNTARLTIGSSSSSKIMGNDVPPPLSAHGEDDPIVHEFDLYRDEFDTYLPDRIPLRYALNFFERSRSNYFGGPDSLRKLQKEHNIVLVVTSITQGSIITAAENDNGGGIAKCLPGRRKVAVSSTFTTKRRGMITECHQTLLCGETNERLAQAAVTILVLNELTRKPTTDLPPYFLELIRRKV